MSAHGVQYLETKREEKPEYVTCSEGDNISAVNIIINETREAVVECKTLIEGCYQCSSSSDKTTVTCESCSYGYHLTVTESAAIDNKFGIKIKDTCNTCTQSFGDHCLDCSEQGCTMCEPTYELDQ